MLLTDAGGASHAHNDMTDGLSATEREGYAARGYAAPFRTLSTALIAPARLVVRDLAIARPWQDMLSGIHNPFGYHACADRAWSFLDIAESAELLDVVADAIGPDIVLWDSELFLDLADVAENLAEFWPVEPLSGALAVVSMERQRLFLVDIERFADCRGHLPAPVGPAYVLSYMSAWSRFNRDPLIAPNRRMAATRPLVNYEKRPLWLVRGEDRGGNDFDVGFSVRVGQWAGADFGPRPDEQDYDCRSSMEGE